MRQILSSTSASANGKSAFTLIELLVVVSIIALLVSILLPSLSQARESARTAVCASNMHQIALATILYGMGNQDLFPSIDIAVYWTGYLVPPDPDKADERLGHFYMLDDYIQSTTNVTVCPTPPADFHTLFGFPRGPQNYIAGSSWAGLPDQLGVFGHHGPIYLPHIWSEPARFGEIARPAQVVMLSEKSICTGRRGDATAFFQWYWMWAPNPLMPIFFEPFHGNKDSMNYAFCDGHVQLYNVEKVPYPDSVLYDNDWDEMGISYRRNY